MKDSRFIELLNLYVDQQLTAPEAGELETEISKNPERRRTYQQYCRMQNACARLFESERNHAPASLALSKALAEADRKIVAFPQRRPVWMRGTSVVGFAAAAACVVFVVLPRQRQGAQEVVSSAPVDHLNLVSATSPAQTTAPVVQTKTAARPEFYSVFTTRRLAPATSEVVDSEPSLDTSADRVNLDWMRRVDLQPLRPAFSDQFAFETQQTLPRETSDLNNRHSSQNAPVEKTVFMFTR